MSFLTTFPEDVYPTRSLSVSIQTEAFGIELAQALMDVTSRLRNHRGQDRNWRRNENPAHLERWGFECVTKAQSGRHRRDCVAEPGRRSLSHSLALTRS